MRMARAFSENERASIHTRCRSKPTCPESRPDLASCAVFDKSQSAPCHAHAPIAALDGLRLDVQCSSQAMSICELNCLSRRNVEHSSSFRNRAVTQGHDQHGAVAQESADVRHRPTTFVFVKVHPNGRQHHEVEFFSSRLQDRKIWQPIVQPFNPRRRMLPDSGNAQRIRRFDCYSRTTLCRLTTARHLT